MADSTPNPVSSGTTGVFRPADRSAWWERWRDVHEALGDETTAEEARARAATL